MAKRRQKVRVTLRLPADLYDNVKNISDVSGVSINVIAISALRKALPAWIKSMSKIQLTKLERASKK